MLGVTPEEALKKGKLEGECPLTRSRSASKTVVGCAECHTLNSEKHKDVLNTTVKGSHRGHSADCAVCHPAKTSNMQEPDVHAYGNPYTECGLCRPDGNSVNATPSFDKARPSPAPNPETAREFCLYCHGTEVKVAGVTKRTRGWRDGIPGPLGVPNQESAESNPDGKQGSCAAAMHATSFPLGGTQTLTCSHVTRPGFPAFGVYEVSKHGTFTPRSAKSGISTPSWKIGKDLTAPTCATCHVSLTVSAESGESSPNGPTVGDRIAWRIMG